MVKLLLKYGANPNVVDKTEGKYKNMTTMHIAAFNSNVNMIKLLIEYQFDTNKLINNIIMSNKYRCISVFLILCSNGNVECLKYLLSICKTNTNTDSHEQKNDKTDSCDTKTTEGRMGNTTTKSNTI